MGGGETQVTGVLTRKRCPLTAPAVHQPQPALLVSTRCNRLAAPSHMLCSLYGRPLRHAQPGQDLQDLLALCAVQRQISLAVGGGHLRSALPQAGKGRISWCSKNGDSRESQEGRWHEQRVG